jgi:hypothetical protein
MSASPDLRRLLDPVRAAAKGMPREALPGLCGALAELQAEILLPPPPEPRAESDRQLSPKQAAEILGRSSDWVSKHRHELPITRLPSGRWTVSEKALRRWLRTRSTG